MVSDRWAASGHPGHADSARLGQRAAGDVAAEPLETRALPRADAHGRVQGEAVGVGAQLLPTRGRPRQRSGRGERARRTSAACLESARRRNRGAKLLPYLCTFCEAHEPTDPAVVRARAELQRIFGNERSRVHPVLRDRCLALLKPPR